MKKILFVDLDGTIRQTKSGKTFINDPKDQQLVNGAMQALKRYHDKNWLIVGITNQGGVPNYMTLADAIAGCHNTIELSQGLIEAVFMAPGMEGEYCWKVASHELINVSRVIPGLAGTYRKPGTGMVEFACNHFLVEPSVCLFVGDRPEDEQCAVAAGIDFILADRWRQDEGGAIMIGRHGQTWDYCAQIQKMLEESPGGWEILTDRQKQVVDCIRRDDTASLTEIGRQLGVSRERIRQHIYKVQWRLKKYRAANVVTQCRDY